MQVKKTKVTEQQLREVYSDLVPDPAKLSKAIDIIRRNGGQPIKEGDVLYIRFSKGVTESKLSEAVGALQNAGIPAARLKVGEIVSKEAITILRRPLQGYDLGFLQEEYDKKRDLFKAGDVAAKKALEILDQCALAYQAAHNEWSKLKEGEEKSRQRRILENKLILFNTVAMYALKDMPDQANHVLETAKKLVKPLDPKNIASLRTDIDGWRNKLIPGLTDESIISFFQMSMPRSLGNKEDLAASIKCSARHIEIGGVPFLEFSDPKLAQAFINQMSDRSYVFEKASPTRVYYGNLLLPPEPVIWAAASPETKYNDTPEGKGFEAAMSSATALGSAIEAAANKATVGEGYYQRIVKEYDALNTRFSELTEALKKTQAVKKEHPIEYYAWVVWKARDLNHKIDALREKRKDLILMKLPLWKKEAERKAADKYLPIIKQKDEVINQKSNELEAQQKEAEEQINQLEARLTKLEEAASKRREQPKPQPVHIVERDLRWAKVKAPWLEQILRRKEIQKGEKGTVLGMFISKEQTKQLFGVDEPGNGSQVHLYNIPRKLLKTNQFWIRYQYTRPDDDAFHTFVSCSASE